MARVSQHSQSGVTLIELLTVVALGSIMVVTGVVYSIPWMARETTRSAVHDANAFLQRAKIESVARNRQCRFVVDATSGALEVWDSRGTSSTSDDELLHAGRIHESVGFDRPDSGGPITLEQIGSSTRFQTVFDPSGMVDSGTGDLYLAGGERWGRISVHAAGGVEIRFWDGNQWVDGA